jgi:hypothetical protein
LNPGPPEYNAGVLTAQPRRSVRHRGNLKSLNKYIMNNVVVKAVLHFASTLSACNEGQEKFSSTSKQMFPMIMALVKKKDSVTLL